jgi:hypothetical protein
MWKCKSFYQVVCFIQLSEERVLSVSLKMDKIEYRAVIKYFADLTKNHYRDGTMALQHRWNKCISFKGNYVEN